MINVQNVSKTFILHQQNGVRPARPQSRFAHRQRGRMRGAPRPFRQRQIDTLLRSLYANYLPDEGQIQIKHGDEWVDLVTAPARKVVEIRKNTRSAG